MEQGRQTGCTGLDRDAFVGVCTGLRLPFSTNDKTIMFKCDRRWLSTTAGRLWRVLEGINGHVFGSMSPDGVVTDLLARHDNSQL